jgi:hypothetical protein
LVQGVSWRAGYQASDLITRGELPPFLVVGIDSPGPMRSLNYLPYAPGELGVGWVWWQGYKHLHQGR